MPSATRRPPGRIRVLRVLARANVGGPALQVAALTAGLDPERFETRLLVGAVEPHEGDYFDLRAPDVPFVRVRGLGRAVRPADDMRALREVVRHVRDFQPHIVHTHTAKAGVLGRVAARRCRVPATVHTFHGHLLQGYFGPARTRLVVTVERLLAARTSRIVAVGTRVRDELVAAGIGRREQYAVVPPGIRLAALPSRAEARAALCLPDDAQVVAFVGRITGVKRPDRFAEVALELAARRPRARFVVAGGGDLAPQLAAALAPLAERALMLGWRADVETIYAAADVVVNTSDNEGMPVSLIEAAAYGCPAVATDVGSASEVVSHAGTGLVVAPRVADLVDALQRLLDDPQMRALYGSAAAAHANSAFGADRLISDIERIYEEIAREQELRLER